MLRRSPFPFFPFTPLLFDFFFLSLVGKGCLHVATTGDHDGLSAEVAHVRAAGGEDGAGGLGGGAGPPQRDVGVRGLRLRGGGRGLLARDSERDLLAVREGDEGALLLGVRQAGHDVAEGDGVGADAELRAPLLRDRLGQADDAGLGQGVVGLARVAVDARGGGDVDDHARLTVLDAEVGSGGADQAERRGAVQADDGVPLLVGDLCAPTSVIRRSATGRSRKPTLWMTPSQVYPALLTMM